MKLKPESIRRRMDFNDLMDKYALRIQLKVDQKFEDRNPEEIPIAAWVYVFSDRDVENFMDHIVEFTYDETFKMIKRNVEAL